MQAFASNQMETTGPIGAMAYTDSRSCMVVGRNYLLQAGVTQVLSSFGISVSEDKGGDLQSVSVILVVADSDDEIADLVADWRERAPGANFVVVAESGGPQTCRAAAAAGAVGVIDRAQSAAEMYDTIGRVFEGERVFPSAVAGEAPAHRATPVTVGDGIVLNTREHEILCGIAAGLTNREIAEALGACKVRTKSQVRTVLRKLGVANRTQAALWANVQGIDGSGVDAFGIR